MFDNMHMALRNLQADIRRANVPLREVFEGDRLLVGPDCSIRILHPPRHGVLGRDNANSVVVLVECYGRRILLTGDLEPPGLDDLLAESPLACDVLLVPHHGSAQSEPESLAQWSTPRWAIFSADRRWDIRPVEAAYRKVGARALHTAETGAITFSIDPAGIDVQSMADGGH